jgi:small GTP-binding protein
MNDDENHNSEGYIFKVVLVGDGAVGKSALIYRYMQSTFMADYLPTIGTQIYTKTVVGTGGSKIKLVVWDISGQPAYHDVRPSYYKGAMAVLLVYDLTRVKTFEDLEGWLGEAKRYASDPVLVLVGNKSDLESERRVSRESGEGYASKIEAQYLETSAKDGSNVAEAFTALADRLVMRISNTVA